MNTYQNTMDILNPERSFMLKHIHFDKLLTQAKGIKVIDEDGTEYIDYTSQYGTVSFGHNPEFIWQALELKKQSNSPSLSQPFYNQDSLELAQGLIDHAPSNMSYVTFVNSGAEAVEAGLKLARVKTGNTRVISTSTGFHGKTYSALSATGNPKFKYNIDHDSQRFTHIDINDEDQLEEAFGLGDVAAFIIEPLQGEGGLHLASTEFMKKARALCDAHGALLIIDEVQTGFGRTGYLFASEMYKDLKIDILLVAKALGGGMVPIGAMLCNKKTWSEHFGLAHSSTFANNGFTSAVGKAVLDRLLQDDASLIQSVKEKGQYLGEQLNKLVDCYPKAFKQARGLGYMWGLEFADQGGDEGYFIAHQSGSGFLVPIICGYLLQKFKVLTLPTFSANNVLRVAPPLIMEKPDLDKLINALAYVGELITKANFAELFSYLAGSPQSFENEEIPETPAQLPLDNNNTTGKRLGSFAFLIHPTDANALEKNYPAALQLYSAEKMQAFNQWVGSVAKKFFDPAVQYHAERVYDKHGNWVEGWLIGCTLTPAQMMKLSKENKKRLFDGYFKCAHDLGVDRVGLGAFTSVISRAGVSVVNNEFEIDVTTGNSLTAITSVEGLVKADKQHRGSISDAAAVIGAAGSVGRLAALHLTRFYAQITLFGNPNNSNFKDSLINVAGEMYALAYQHFLVGDYDGIAGSLALIINHLETTDAFKNTLNDLVEAKQYQQLATEIQQQCSALGQPEIINMSINVVNELGAIPVVLSATSAAQSFIEPEWLAENAVVCDSARPSDMKSEVYEKRPDVFVFEGAILTLPDPSLRFGPYNILGFPTGLNLACLSETMSLAMAQRSGHYSIGTSPSYDEALQIYKDALDQGYGISLHQPDKVVSQKPAKTVAAL